MLDAPPPPPGLAGPAGPSVPASASDLSTHWLSEALGAEVVGVEILDHAFATNQRVRIALTYATPGAGPASLFAKLAPIDPAHREMIGATGMGVREAQFYADIAPTVGLRVPRSYCAATADDGNFVLLLEDLAASGCAFSDGAWGVTADAAAVALEDLARFHGHFADPQVRAASAPWLATPRPRMDEATASLMRYVLDEHGDALTPAYIAIGDMYVDKHRRMDDVWHEGPQTYIHGDAHIGNVFIDNQDQGRVGFHDWGMSRESTPLRDASYFLTMTVEPEERRRTERDLLRIYLDALLAAGGPEIGFDDAWFVYRVQASYTVVATFLAFMPSYLAGDGQELGVALRTRSELALEDLEVVEATRTALG